ncbi:hypothetical protein IWX47DRAFT_118917 [Phyllosticta citricarpa]
MHDGPYSSSKCNRRREQKSSVGSKRDIKYPPRASLIVLNGFKTRPQNRWFKRSLAVHLVITLLFFAALVYSQGKTATWELGMDLRLFVAKDETVTTCPPSVQEAERNGGTLPIWSNEGKIITTKPALPAPQRKTSLSFRLVNGWVAHKGAFDSNSQTLVQASEPASTGGGCWASVAGGNIEARACGTDRMSQFYVSFFFPFGAFMLNLCSLRLTRTALVECISCTMPTFLKSKSTSNKGDW